MIERMCRRGSTISSAHFDNIGSDYCYKVQNFNNTTNKNSLYKMKNRIFNRLHRCSRPVNKYFKYERTNIKSSVYKKREQKRPSSLLAWWFVSAALKEPELFLYFFLVENLNRNGILLLVCVRERESRGIEINKSIRQTGLSIGR